MEPVIPTAIPPCPENANRIIFAADVAASGANFEIFSMNPDGSDIVQVTNHPGFDEYPSWSPERCRIAFSSNVGEGNDEIFIVNSEGSGLTRVTNEPYKIKMPTWSPDGRTLAFIGTSAEASLTHGIEDVHIIQIDGSVLVDLTNNAIDDSNPDW